MANNNTNFDEEPNTAPESDRWYNITLGTSFNDHHQQPHTFSSPKFCTLRYEFKPASIDKSQPGLLRKRKDNGVTVEYQNNQHGKPKVIFDGVSEDYKENDAVLFFDGETFRLERLHHAVKRLRLVRLPGESAAAAGTTATTAAVVAPTAESYAPPTSKGVDLQPLNKSVPDKMSEIHVEQRCIDDPEGLVNALTSAAEQHVDVKNDANSHSAALITENAPETRPRMGLDIDINLPHQADTDDDEIANVDISDDDTEKGLNAAEALKAQVNAAEGRGGGTSSSSSSSESDGSGSDNVSDSTSSSDSKNSDGDSPISV